MCFQGNFQRNVPLQTLREASPTWVWLIVLWEFWLIGVRKCERSKILPSCNLMSCPAPGSWMPAETGNSWETEDFIAHSISSGQNIGDFLYPLPQAPILTRWCKQDKVMCTYRKGPRSLRNSHLLQSKHAYPVLRNITLSLSPKAVH